MSTIVEEDTSFRKMLLIATRVLAFLLILAIFWIGYVQMMYAVDVNMIRKEYGSLGYCYLCGKETYRVCSCQYIEDLKFQIGIVDYQQLALDAAERNIIPCEDKNKKINVSSLRVLNST